MESLPVPGRVLAVLRLILGGTVWAAPRASGDLFGINVKDNPGGAYLGRLFAVRDAGLGVGLIGSRGPDDRRLWWPVNVASDSFDLLAMAASHRRGELSDRAIAANAPAAVLALTLGIAGWLQDRAADA